MKTFNLHSNSIMLPSKVKTSYLHSLQSFLVQCLFRAETLVVKGKDKDVSCQENGLGRKHMLSFSS